MELPVPGRSRRIMAGETEVGPCSWIPFAAMGGESSLRDWRRCFSTSRSLGTPTSSTKRPDERGGRQLAGRWFRAGGWSGRTIGLGLAIEQNGGLFESAALGLPEVHEDEDSLERKPANVAIKDGRKLAPQLGGYAVKAAHTRGNTSSPTSRAQRG